MCQKEQQQFCSFFSPWYMFLIKSHINLIYVKFFQCLSHLYRNKYILQSCTMASLYLFIAKIWRSLANALPFYHMRPHKIYKNILKIATNLDAALKKVSNDSHKLLVHAKECDKSKQRLQQSLQVQTCEIRGCLAWKLW